MLSHRFIVNPRRTSSVIGHVAALAVGLTYFSLWLFRPDMALGLSRLLVALVEGIAP